MKSDFDDKLAAMEAGMAGMTAPTPTLFTGSLFEPGLTAFSGVRHRKRHTVARMYPFALFTFDLVLITTLYLIAVYFRYESATLVAYSRRILVIVTVASIVPVLFLGGYEYRQNMQQLRFLCEHAIGSTCGGVVAFTLIYSIAFYGTNYNSARSTVLFPLVAFPLLSMAYRYWLTRIKNQLRRGNAVCIIGAGAEAHDVYQRLRAAGSTQMTFVADDREERVGGLLLPEDADSPRVRRLDEIRLHSSMEGKFVECYVITRPLNSLPQDFIKRLVVAQFQGNRVYTYEAFLAEVLRVIPPTRLSLAWAFSDGFRLNRGVIYDRMKRLSDVIMASVGLLVLTPVMSAVTVAVWLTSPGPVIFKQMRVGERERPFMLYKFRSMRVGSDRGPKYTQKNDSRLTPIGAFIRKTRLDELPQLWNVLRGDISMIGPRAEWIELVQNYEKKFPFYHFRHAVKPGITGWAQVNYTYGASEADTLEKLNYDLYYVRHYSFVLDMTIFVKTIYMMIFAQGR